MNKAIVTCFILVLMVGLASADEKADCLDTAGHAQALTSASRTQFTGVFDDTSPVWDRVFCYNGIPPTLECDLPMNDSASDGQCYAQFCITSTDDNPIEITVNADLTEVVDTTLYLYCESFDVTQPLDNAVFYDDDGHPVELLSQIGIYDNIVLPVGVPFWVVLSTYASGDLGAFALDTSENLVPCGGVATEVTDWSAIKGLFR